MPKRTERVEKGGKSLFHMLFLAAALSLLSAVVRRERRQLIMTTKARKKVRVAPRRLAASLAFATLFFAGAAFSAGAGNTVTKFFDEDAAESTLSADAMSSTDTTTTEEQPAAEAPAGDPAAEAPDPEPSGLKPSAVASAAASAEPTQVPVSAPVSNSQSAGVQAAVGQRAKSVGFSGTQSSSGNASDKAKQKAKQKTRAWAPKSFLRQPPVVKPDPGPLRAPVDREAEADEPNVDATVWLYRALPDPTPPSRRLKPGFARKLQRISARNHVDWALTLAVLRASGERGSTPASASRLRVLTKQLHARKARKDPWSSVLALEGRTTFADRTVALMNLYRAVGLKALVKGFDWAKPSLSKRILNDKRISMYPGGRSDIERGRVNVRILVLIAYLAEAHGQVTVSCLISGHRLYARPGVISAHIFGLAIDISVLGGTSILGHQQPDSVTEKAVRNILLLPAEMQPRQLISLIGMGGPSFPLANHDDHIHVGY
jgi:hypothetical protein